MVGWLKRTAHRIVERDGAGGRIGMAALWIVLIQANNDVGWPRVVFTLFWVVIAIGALYALWSARHTERARL